MSCIFYLLVGYSQGTDEEAGTKVENFKDLINAVKDIGNWRALCLNFDVDAATMDSLKYSGESIEDRKLACLRAFYDSGDATWEKVIRGVEMHPINNPKLAKEIKMKYISKDEL